MPKGWKGDSERHRLIGSQSHKNCIRLKALEEILKDEPRALEKIKQGLKAQRL